jgi:hypothetical protein
MFPGRVAEVNAACTTSGAGRLVLDVWCCPIVCIVRLIEVRVAQPQPAWAVGPTNPASLPPS